MNKKFLFGMFAAAGMLLATSCQNDELDLGQSGNEATVSFNLGVRNGVQTRTISDGESADKLIYAVYNADKQLITTISGSQNGQFVKEGSFANGLSENVSITLAKGQTYTAIFWAQDADCDAYNTEDLTNIIVDYAGVNNDESRDAFFGVQEFTVNGNASIDVNLKRPFAQMNVGVTQTDWDAAVASEITISESKVKLSEVPNSINLMDGTVSGAHTVEYSLNAIPTEKLLVDGNGDGTKEEYVYLSMNYFLADDTKTLVDNVEFTFKPTSGNEIVLNQGLNNVPVQRNWRTNILGKFLTGDIDFNIVIVPAYDGEYNGLPFEGKGVKAGDKYYSTLAEALTNGETDIMLAAGEYTLDVNFNQDVTITGVDKENVKVKTTKSIYGDQYKNSLTLKNLTVDVPKGLAYNESGFAFMHRLKNVTMENCNSSGRIRLNVENGLINNCEFNVDTKSGFDGYAIYYYGGNNSNVKVSNSTFNTAGKAIVLYNEAAMVMNLEVENCTFASSDADTDKAAIQMHTEYGISGTVNIANSTATGFLKENGGLWNELNNKTGEKTEKFVVTVDGLTYSDEADAYVISSKDDLVNLAQAVNNGNNFEGSTIKLTDNIDLQNELWTPIGNKTNKFCGSLDGNNKTISNLKVSTDKGAQGLIGFAGGTLAVTNLTINNAEVNSGDGSAVGAVVGKADGSKITFSNIKVTGVVKLHAKYGQVGAVLGNNPNGAVYASDIVVDVEEGSYVSTEGNMGNYYDYVGGVFGQIWGSTFANITSNIDVITDYGLGAGGISGGATGTWTNISCSGDVTVTNVDETKWYTNADPNGNSYGDVYYWQGSGKIIGYHGGVTYTNCTSTGTLKIGDKTSNGLYFYNSAGEKVEDSRFGCSRWGNDNTVTIND